MLNNLCSPPRILYMNIDGQFDFQGHPPLRDRSF